MSVVMRDTPTFRIRFGLRRFTAVAAFLALAGCAGFDPSFGMLDGQSGAAVEDGGLTADETALAQTPPRYEVGDVYAFDNPEVTWQVVAIDGGQIKWVSDTGEKQTTVANPLLPALAWESKRRGSGKRLISDTIGKLFPLEVGNKMTFKSTVSTDKPPYAWEFDWSCEVLARESIESPAGEFNTFKVMCGRHRPDELVFNYAPKVGHYLRMEVAGEIGEQPLIRNLVGFRRVAAARPVTQVVASQGLVPPLEPESAGSGGSLEWSGGGAASIAPVVSEEAMAPGTETVMEAPKSSVSVENSVSTDQPIALANVTEAVSGQPTVSGEYAIHLASYKKQANADKGWQQLQSQLPGLIGNLKPVVKRVDLGSKGIFYRLFAAPVESRTAGTDLCRKIKARGVYCKVDAL